MSLQKKILIMCLISCSLCFSSCIGPRKIKNFPQSPELTQYTEGPILEKTKGGNFMVTKELVSNSIMLTDYYKRIDKWKEANNVR